MHFPTNTHVLSAYNGVLVHKDIGGFSMKTAMNGWSAIVNACQQLHSPNAKYIEENLPQKYTYLNLYIIIAIIK